MALQYKDIDVSMYWTKTLISWMFIVAKVSIGFGDGLQVSKVDRTAMDLARPRPGLPIDSIHI